jgi:anti-anti-sigma factor
MAARLMIQPLLLLIWLVPMSSLDEPQPGTQHVGWSQRCADNVVVVHLAGDLDMSTLDELRLKLCVLVGSVDAGTVVIDLSELEFISAGPVGAILSARDAAAARGKVLCVDGLHGISARVFEVLGLESLVCGSSNGSR